MPVLSTPEPHRARRHEILAKHPEVRDLAGTEPRTAPIVACLVLTQIALAYYVSTHYNYCSWQFWVLAYAVGGTINHALQLAAHELSHDLCWSGPHKDALNRATAILANLPTGVPSSQSFKVYHLEHHHSQGVEGVDTDLPSDFERRVITTPLRKLIWLIAQPLCYGIRPLLIRPKRPTPWEIANVIVQLSFDLMVVHVLGLTALMYLLAGTLLGMGLHPAAGHFVAEHYELTPGSETYSYYGPCNWVNFNVGYHVEHHDFPRIPWSRLPEVRRLAPEFYEQLPSYSSYVREVFLPFIFSFSVNLNSRVRRNEMTTTTKSAKCE